MENLGCIEVLKTDTDTEYLFRGFLLTLISSL